MRSAKDAQEMAEKVLACVEEELEDLCEEALQQTGDAYQAQEEAEKKLADCEGKLEELRDESGEPKIVRILRHYQALTSHQLSKEMSQLKPNATCKICTLTM